MDLQPLESVSNFPYFSTPLRSITPTGQPSIKYEEGAEAMDHGVGGAGGGEGNSAGQGNILQGSSEGGNDVREKELGHNEINYEGAGRITSPH